jgi:hypothetical protein
MPSPLYAEHEGATVLVHAYLSTPSDEARLLSVGGPAEAVKAVLAGLVSRSSMWSPARAHHTSCRPRLPSPPSLDWPEWPL